MNALGAANVLAFDEDTKQRWLATQVREIEEKLELLDADVSELTAKHEQAASAVADWTRKAESAVRQGSDDLARSALARKAEHERIAHELHQQISHEKGAIEIFAEALEELRKRF